MAMFKPFVTVFILLQVFGLGSCCTLYFAIAKTESYQYWCGPWKAFRCTGEREVYELKSQCCEGWTGEDCLTPICNDNPDPNISCSVDEGRVQTRDGIVYTSSGGKCVFPETCEDCNPGYYKGSICRECQTIDNCLHASCTSADDSVCEYCDGELSEQYGWYAYTRFYPGDNKKKCRQACSWRSGSRCYPGSCSDTTTASCTCVEGLTGPDCDTITQDPLILQNFLKLTETTTTSANHVEAPPDSGGGSPQERVWTNNAQLERFSGYIDANFKRVLPSPPEDFYVKLDESELGLIDFGIKLELIRGSVRSGNTILKTCVPEPADDNRCDFNGTFSDSAWPVPFEEGDILKFTAFATNGGFVSIYNRENNNKLERYDIAGRTKENEFEVWFDINSPVHCVVDNPSCQSQPLFLKEFTTKSSVSVTWAGWEDTLSGLESFHLEVFHLKPTGSELVQGDKVTDAVTDKVPADTLETMVTLPAPGPYAVTITAFDIAGNYKTARRLTIHDDNSSVSQEGSRNIRAGVDGLCTWSDSPSPPIFENADPNINCDWITKPTSVINIIWKDRYINKKQYYGQWLNSVRPVAGVDAVLDDNDGQRKIEKIDNVLGIVSFQCAYNVTFEGTEMSFPFQHAADIHSESFSLNLEVQDGMKIDAQIRATDCFGEFADDYISVKVDNSAPIIENLMLVRGDITNVAVHNVEDLSQLQFEWKVSDLHSGIHEVSWRILDNYTGVDIEHGKAFLPPQSAQTQDSCTNTYSSYPRGADCYCTPFDGCFHQHFHVQPEIHSEGTNGLHPSKQLATHDSDYFIEVKATNKVMLTTTKYLKVTIDISPPVAGSVHEGLRGYQDLDFQQDKTIEIYWDGFFDKESGIKFYRYGYGTECLNAEAFDINSNELYQTTSTEASFEVKNEGKYFVTLAAYNYALDRSAPVCSDGIIIDTSVPNIYGFSVHRSKVESRLLRDINDSYWLLHEDRTRQKVKMPSEICRSHAIYITKEELQMLPLRRNATGNTEEIALAETDDCRSFMTESDTIISFVHDWKYLHLSWNTTGIKSGVYDFEVGISSTKSEIPDLVEFQSSSRHSQLTISHPNLNGGSLFYFVVKAVSRSGVENIQIVGPFMLLTMPPTFDTGITVSYKQDQNISYLIASWSDIAVQEGIETMKLTYQYALGSHRYGTDLQSYTNLNFIGSCVFSTPPKCTAVSLENLDWSLHHGQEYYITVFVNNSQGYSTRVSSKPYKHDILKPSAGVVIDIDSSKADIVSDNDDIDYQKSATEISARWYGFDHFYDSIRYTACIMDADDVILQNTCKYVGEERTVTLSGVLLTPFKKYKVLVKAETETADVSVTSDGVIVIDDEQNLENILVFDGEQCTDDAVIIPSDKTHHAHNISRQCIYDKAYQASSHKLSAHWTIPEDWITFVPDLYWHVEEKALDIEHWSSKTEEAHASASAKRININLPLTAGWTYRFALKFCAMTICYNTRYTSGIIIIPSPPKTGKLSVTYNSDFKKIDIVFEKFQDDDIEMLTEAQGVIDYYEWNIADNDVKGRVMNKWNRIQDVIAVNATHLKFEAMIPGNIKFTKCWYFMLRGTNKVGSSAVVAKQIKPCDDPDHVKPATVIDCVGLPDKNDDIQSGVPIELGVNQRWLQDDKDYTPYSNLLSAVWPGLRHTRFEWAVIELHTTDPVLYYSDSPSLQKPCDSPDKISCGITEKNYINVFFDSEPLLNGHRYVLCIHADAETLQHEYWKEELPETTTCSDGVTVDTTPPQPGSVWIHDKNTLYQTSKSEVTIYWEKFVDIEELGNHVHESGISHYEVALGSFYGGTDVVTTTDVGIVSHVTFHDLKLQDGHKYFATVTGYDFTGKHSSVTSAPIIVDTTPPDKTSKTITMKTKYITELHSIEACWTGIFRDSESGMALYKWAVGSRPGYDDKYMFEETTETCSETKKDYPTSLEDGHSYFITVMGFNNAELFSVASSWAFTVDTSPPIKGYVNDGNRNADGSALDIDYQSEISELTVHWGGFNDPHTPIEEYILSIGTSRDGFDILNAQSVGSVTDITVNHLELREGTTYFVTVKACNVAGLCVSAASDGVLIDSSPPVPGKILDGTGDTDIRYQASNNNIGTKWYGFTDSQSGLSHFTWSVGTTPYGDDIIPAREVHLHEEAFIPDLSRALNKNLPVNKNIYNTVRAYNKAGLYSESVSNGFIVDNTLPVFATSLQHVPIGSLRPSTSVLRSTLKVKWNVVDSQSFISTQYLSMAAHRGDDFNTTLKIGGFVRDYTFTKLNLHDGGLYSINLIACNGARLCSSSTIPNLLVDSSPPTAGTFAINTDHAVSDILDRQPEGWMTWELNRIHLAWLGFTDIHSDILEYHINIGSTYMADDLNEYPGQPFVVTNDSSVQASTHVQATAISTQSLVAYEHVYVSLWAVNGVGLKSEIIHSQFLLVPGGKMQLIRRCEGQTCQGHCVCAAQDLKCGVDAGTQDCLDKTGDTSYAVVDVKDIIYTSGEAEDTFRGTHTPCDTMLSAKWSLNSGTEPVWYEWSVGLSDYDLPVGIFDSHARVWHDAGRLLEWTFSLPRGSTFLEGERYSFFVRAWFNTNTFSTFKSHGVIILTSAPETTVLFGKTVEEIREHSDEDVDYIKPNEVLIASWGGKFKNAGSTISRYRLFISTEPNGRNVHRSQEEIPPDTTRYNITGLYPDSSTRYYTNVVAYNEAGLHAVATSDGCQIDDDKPVAGVVYDGAGFRDISYQNTASMVSASWQGFVDLGSGLWAYHWCVSPADDVGSCSVLPTESTGLANLGKRELPSHAPNGVKLVSEVYATDRVGHTSERVFSDGVVIDVTPPIRQYHMSFGDNLLSNPSFEETLTGVTIATLSMTHLCPYDSPNAWVVTENSCAITVKATADTVKNGTSFVVLKGSISQALTGLNINSVYRLNFYTSHIPPDTSTKSNNEGFVSFDDEKHVFMMYSKPNRSDHETIQLSWHFHSFTFKPKHSEMTLVIGTFENSAGIAIDSVELKESISTTDDTDAKGHVLLHTVFLHDWSSLHASWNFVDDESGIQEYLWAIGTVQGGIQIQDFKSVGTRMFDSNNNLFLPHNATIYVTVVAINGAGLRTVSYSDPYCIDLTPPVFEYVNDGIEEGNDVDYQSSLVVGLNFKVSDQESAIDICSWGVGTQPGDTSLQKFETLPSSQYSSQREIEEQLAVTKIFVVVHCENKAGLSSTMSSDGVSILRQGPSANNAVVEVVGKSPSQYLTHDFYHGTRDSLRIRWSGFEEGHLIEKYKVDVTGPGRVLTTHVYEYSPGYTYATFVDLPAEDGLYNVSVTGINYLNTESEPVSTSVNVLTQAPEVRDDIEIGWNNSTEEVIATWTDVFFSSSPLYYEVSAGTIKGGGDIIQWQETSNTELIFNLAKDDIGLNGKTVFIVVRAIAFSGTYNTAQKELLIRRAD